MTDDEREAVALIANALDEFSWNGAGHLTCSETDGLAEGLALLGHPDAGESLIWGHAEEDDEGDEHYGLTEEDVHDYLLRLLERE